MSEVEILTLRSFLLIEQRQDPSPRCFGMFKTSFCFLLFNDIRLFSQVGLGQLYFQGARGVDVDYEVCNQQANDLQFR